MATFDELIKQVNENVSGNRNRGTAFERIVVSYLKNEPTYKHQFDHVWLLKDVPFEYHIPKKDLGVDIVAENSKTKKLTAVQAKFYKSNNTVKKPAIDSFLAEAGKKYYDNAIYVSTGKLDRNATEELKNRKEKITVITLDQLKNADINWQLFDFEGKNENLTRSPRPPRNYQKPIIQKAVEYFRNNDRGKLIMAPGTGKTYTSLKIAEGLLREQNKSPFFVLYLVPSIQLLTQTLFSWNNDMSTDIDPTSFSIVSDRKATKNTDDPDDLSAIDIGAPATTSTKIFLKNYKETKFNSDRKQMVVVFSTYQSIDVVIKAQKMGFPEFDLVVADEAHRTTGVSELGDPKEFTKVNYNNLIRAKKRLYQTATPKIYGDKGSTKRKLRDKADQQSLVISSMDDEKIYGKEIYRLGFGKAVDLGALTDYKVSIISVSRDFIDKNMEGITKQKDNELSTNDIGKIIGVWNAMVKRNGVTGEIDGAPMKRAIAFCKNIASSKEMTAEFNEVINKYLGNKAKDSYHVEVKHAQGSMNVQEKRRRLNWLKGDIPENHARILSNVKFLTEGVDVPNLDAVIFFSPKKSQVDIVQAVGRIMRSFKDKEYGYIIIPVVIDSDTDPQYVLDHSEKFKEVWQVLNALRATDDRFDAVINQIQWNKKKPNRISIHSGDGRPTDVIDEGSYKEQKQVYHQLSMEFKNHREQWEKVENAFYGRIVKKVGDRRYLEDFSDDVAEIAKRHERKINNLIDTKPAAKQAFEQFLKGLRHNVNDSITRNQAIEMMSQHLITKPIFDAMFSNYHFAQNNPVSKVLDTVIAYFSLYGFNKDQKSLEPLYESVKTRASGLDNVQAKQHILIELYQRFFKAGFPDITDEYGTIFTPIEVVDFIIHSVDWSLRKYFHKSLASKNVHILDPFTGTGTFITRTLLYLEQEMKKGEITYDDILNKYLHELHANEILLLSYYIAAVNIEAVFDEINGPQRGYQPFKGIVLTDTFESTENRDVLDEDVFGSNNERLKKQQQTPITVIISNPPYSVGQKNANDNNQNVRYPKLEHEIEQTYVKNSKSSLSKGSYDSYIKAFRWASDRIKDHGIIGFITNSGYLDKNSFDGFRASLYKEFNHIYIFNLKGAVRGKVGDDAKKEGQNIFNILTGVAIIILIKDNSNQHELYYKNIGDYLSRKQKLGLISEYQSIKNLNCKVIKPNSNNEWINQRNPEYQKFALISNTPKSPFISNAVGVGTNRDFWVSGFSKSKVLHNSQAMIDTYNTELNKNGGKGKKSKMRDPKKIKWTANLDKNFERGKKLNFHGDNLILEMYRPFTKKWLMYDPTVVERPGQYLTKWGKNNRVIYTTGRGSRRQFSCLVLNNIPSLDAMEKGQGFMEYNNEVGPTELIKDRDNINENFAKKIGLSKEDVFAYVYGLLNSKEYQQKYQNDLRKDLARIPIVKDKEKYVEIGKKLMNLHLNYEQVPVYDKVNIVTNGQPNYRVDEMKFARKRNTEGKLVKDRSTIIYNDTLSIENIPEKAYQYIVNGKSAIEWIMDQYHIKVDTRGGSGIVDDPNDYSDDPKYIFNLLLRIINVSIQTVDLINDLPPLKEDDEKDE